jgi:hypothetical protein
MYVDIRLIIVIKMFPVKLQKADISEATKE